MSDPRITIKFRADGAVALQKAIAALSVEQKRLRDGNAAAARMQKKLNRQIDEYNRMGIFGVRNTRNLSFSLSVLRSKLLIAAFGFATLNKTLGSFVRAQGEQELSEKKLEQALGGVNKELLFQASALQQVTAFGDEAIISAQALLAAFVKDEDQLKKATVATLDLAAAKGMDLASAADLVGKTLGSSTNSLSRYGIEVEGTVGSSERLNTLTGNIANTFGGQAKAQTETLTGSIQQMKNAMGDTSEAIGNLLAPTVISIAGFLKEAAENASDFIRGLTETPLETTIRELEELGIQTELLLKLQNIQLGKQLKALESDLKAINKSNFDSISIGEKLTQIEEDIAIAITEKAKIQSEFEKSRKPFIEEQIKFANKTKKDNMDRLKEQGKLNEAKEFGLQADRDIRKLQLELQTEGGAYYDQLISNLNDEQEALIPIAKLLGEQLKIKGQIVDINNIERDTNKKNDEETITDTERIAKLKFESKMREIAMEKKLQAAMTATASQAMKSAGTIKNAHKDILNAMVQEYVARQSLIIADAIASAFKTVPYPFNFVAAAGAGAAAGALLNSLAPKFETGGLVGGRRHSQGGTLIEAERGEFVMSRNAVQSIGVDNLEAMNQGGSAVNITITGNVMTSDFVEGELAEKIRDAVRTGTDFGMS